MPKRERDSVWAANSYHRDFLNGLIHIGEKQIPAGRYDEKPSTGLSEQLAKFNIRIGRLKTGTPPRLDGRTINYDDLEMQPADKEPYFFIPNG